MTGGGILNNYTNNKTFKAATSSSGKIHSDSKYVAITQNIMHTIFKKASVEANFIFEI